MLRTVTRINAIAVVLSGIIVLSANEVSAQNVEQGFDQYATDGGTTFRDFASDPIPANFFGPGSDPFEGQVALRGEPLGSSPFCPEDDLTLVDTIIERRGLAVLPGIPSEDNIAIEMVELSLMSLEPIVITYDGGLDPELWDVAVTLSPAGPSQGELWIRKEHENGGTFDAILDVYPLLTFTRVAGGDEVIWDMGAEGRYDQFFVEIAPWTYLDPPLLSCASNFCADPGGLSIYRAIHAEQGVYSICPAAASGDVQPGCDLYTTEAGMTHRDFGGNPIPADFFGPGSDPFEGQVALMGDPLEWSPHCPDDDLSLIDTIIERQGVAVLPEVPSSDTVPIELVELSLVSLEPIVVTYNGGQSPELWDVAVTVSPTQPSHGQMVLHRNHDNGGTFDAMLQVYPLLTFTRVANGDEFIWDLGAEGLYDEFSAEIISWIYWDSAPWSCASNFCVNPGGLIAYQAAFAQHWVYSVCVQSFPGDVAPGIDLYGTEIGTTARDFAGCPIPADFFAPGSDPFDGQVALMGEPFGSHAACPDDDLSFVDTIIERQDVAHLPAIPSSDNVPIQILDMYLVGVEPIVITYYGGLDPELWDIEIRLSPTQPSTGQMMLWREHVNGGTFNSVFRVYAFLMFTRQADGELRIWDLGAEGWYDEFSNEAVPWTYLDPPPWSCTSNFCADPGGLIVYQADYAQHGVRSVCLAVDAAEEYVDEQGMPSLTTSSPNPVHSSTQITYAVPSREGGTPVVLTIYDIAGRQIRQLVDSTQLPGTYVVTWNGEDRAGQPVAAGVYFYRLIIDGKNLARRLVVVR